MNSDFRPMCRVDTRKFLWLLGLVLGSVLIVQYFELPYRGTMMSLLSSGKAYFNLSTSKEVEIRDEKNTTFPTPISALPKSVEGDDDHLLENTAEMNHETEEETSLRSIGNAPQKPSSGPISFGASNGHGVGSSTSVVASSPSNDGPSVRVVYEGSIIAPSPTRLKVSLAPQVSPSETSLAPLPNADGNKTIVAAPPEQNSLVANSPSSSLSVVVDGSRIAPSPTSLNQSLAAEVSPSETSPPSPSADGKKTSAAAPPDHNSSETNNPPLKESSVVKISDMNDLLLHSHVSPISKSTLWPTAADQELLDARIQIEKAEIVTDRPGLYAPIYRNLTTFVRSYEAMEQKLKVYIYDEGKRPVFHNPRLHGIYASEGWFMKHMKASKQFITNNPDEAHLFYMPFSSQLLVDYVYIRDSHSFDEILKFLGDYLDAIKTRHSFWNRTDGADHFVVACHDWAAFETRRVMPNSIHALCNSDVKVGFRFGKDVALPETNVQSDQNPLQKVGGSPPSARRILAFFAGQMHGYVRQVLLKHWENKDPDMRIFGRLRKGYEWHMKNSKYCICAKGYEVNSPRVVEAITYGCVPVIISDNFVPPFFDVLSWESFSVFVPEKDIPELKNILGSISERRYLVMQHRVQQVRQHFLWHNTPVKYDIFHMILHSIWYNRLFSV